MRTHNNLTTFSIRSAAIITIMITLFGGVLASGCKSIITLASSDADSAVQLRDVGRSSRPRHPDHERVSRLAPADCEVWGFYLLGTMYSLHYQQRLHELKDLLARYRHLGGDNPYGVTILGIRPDMYEILPTRQARAVIDAVLAREGFTCSRELLYETPCRMNRSIVRGHLHERHHNNPPRLIIAADRFSGDMEYTYFADVMGLSMDDAKTEQYEQLLKHHLNQSPESPVELHHFACDARWSRCGAAGTKTIGYEFDNNAAFCLLLKHHDFLQAQDLLDLTKVESFQQKVTEIVAEDLTSFVAKSSAISSTLTVMDK